MVTRDVKLVLQEYESFLFWVVTYIVGFFVSADAQDGFKVRVPNP